MRRIPIIYWSEEWGWKRDPSIRDKVLSPFKRWIITHTDAFLVPGSNHKDYFVSLGAKAERVFLMPNASNLKELAYIPGRYDNLLSDPNILNKKIILYVGRLKMRKGIQYLIEAFSKLVEEMSDVILIIVGTGEYEQKLRNLTLDYGIYEKTYFAGRVSDEILPQYYMLCNVCVVPSITCKIADPWVFIVNEAMTFGKPVIATDAVGAAYDMISNGTNGYIIPEKDSEQLYHAIKIILSDKELGVKMGVESKRIIAEKYQYHHMIEGFEQAIAYVNECKGRL